MTIIGAGEIVIPSTALDKKEKETLEALALTALINLYV